MMLRVIGFVLVVSVLWATFTGVVSYLLGSPEWMPAAGFLSGLLVGCAAVMYATDRWLYR